MGNARVHVATGRPPRTRWTLGLSLVLLLVLSLAHAPQIAAVPQVPAVVEPQSALPPLSGPGIATISNGRIEVDGQPFFPFGFYHVTFYGDAARLMADLRTIGDAGFNTLHAGYLPTHNHGAVLDEAARLGVRVLSEFGEDPANLAALINQYKDKPAVLGWSIADDVDNGRHTPAQVRQLHVQAKAADPRHLTYISGYRPTGSGYPNIGNFMDATDLAAIQTYPVDRAPVNLVSTAVRSAVAAGASQGRPVIANNQTFAWPGRRAPTPAEARNMTYQSLAAGAKGIIYYTFFDGGIHLPTDEPALWAELRSLVPEVNRLAPALLNGVRSELVADRGGDAYATAWSYEGRVYVVVANSSASGAKAFSLQLPAGTLGPAQPLFAGRPAGMTFAGGRLSGTVGPHDVHVYVLDTAASGQQVAQRHFAETGKTVRGAFLNYWQTRGGLTLYGFPISEELVETLEDGREYTVQYFEGARLELPPEPGRSDNVVLGQFGRQIHGLDPPVGPLPGRVYFPETGHTLGGSFFGYWQANGGLAQFGLPLSEEFEEQLENGQVYTVQYFERARLESHPENAPPYDVLLGHFGRRIYTERGLAP